MHTGFILHYITKEEIIKKDIKLYQLMIDGTYCFYEIFFLSWSLHFAHQVTEEPYQSGQFLYDAINTLMILDYIPPTVTSESFP